MSGRPSSVFRGRPPTGSSGRPASGMRGQLGTGRPGTRSGQAAGGNVFGSGIKVADRPMTQQGLGGMKTAIKGQRQIQDRTYWVGEIRSKCTELSSEIRKVESEIVQHQEENNTFLMFEKRAETLAAEIAEIQGELHDYNMMIDRVNMNQDISEMVEDLNALKVRNDREDESLERIFVQKESIEKEISKIEKEIHRQRTLTENRVQDMGPEMRAKYSELKRSGLQTMNDLTKLQDTLEELNSRQSDLEMEMQNDVTKQEAIKLYEKLNELTEKEQQLTEEEQARVSPEQEQQQLLASVKMHNQEISTMDRQNKELEEQIQNIQEEMIQIENDLEDQQSETTDKFRQLQKREQTIDGFMSNFEPTKEQELQQQSQLEESIVVLLEQSSKTLEYGENVPSAKKVRALKDDLQFKEGELQKAESTSATLVGQSSKLQDDLTKVEELEEKMEAEKEAMLKDIERMETEMETHRNIGELKANAEKIKKELRQEKEALERSKLGYKERQERVAQQHNALRKTLEENETHAQLTNMERKWQHLEQNNFAMKEYIASKSVDCESVKGKVMKNITDTNKLLQDLYTKSSLLT